MNVSEYLCIHCFMIFRSLRGLTRRLTPKLTPPCAAEVCDRPRTHSHARALARRAHACTRALAHAHPRARDRAHAGRPAHPPARSHGELTRPYATSYAKPYAVLRQQHLWTHVKRHIIKQYMFLRQGVFKIDQLSDS